jgi:DNA-dependent RNA polymerase auxiliary subunit epsilon
MIKDQFDMRTHIPSLIGKNCKHSDLQHFMSYISDKQLDYEKEQATIIHKMKMK